MYNLADSSVDWARKNEKVSARWGQSEEFLKYYEPVVTTKGEILYKIKEDSLRVYVIQSGLDPVKVPSLNTAIQTWQPATIYQQMKL